jgi:hypothetical protein
MTSTEPAAEIDAATITADLQEQVKAAEAQNMRFAFAGTVPCPVCDHPGIYTVDERGFLIVHQGRSFPCRRASLTDEQLIELVRKSEIAQQRILAGR